MHYVSTGFQFSMLKPAQTHNCTNTIYCERKVIGIVIIYLKDLGLKSFLKSKAMIESDILIKSLYYLII